MNSFSENHSPAKNSPANGGAPLLAMRDVRIVGGGGDGEEIPIVRGVSLHVRRGEILGLIGESGAGKSTLGLAAMGYVRDGCRIVGGEIVFDGEDLAACDEERRRRLRGARIAYVAQSAAAAFNPAHRLIRQCGEASAAHGLSPRAEAEKESRLLFEKLQLPEPDSIGLRYPHQVSGGQLQRIMTAMAMATSPDLIIFDEPTTALDVTTQIEVLAAIREVVREKGAAALYISHDLAVVAQMADRILVLKDGRQVEEAPARTMLESPEEDYTKSLWAVRRFHKDARPPPSSPPLLRAENLHAGYGGVEALTDVSIELHRGRTLAVVGESGSGKSTLARCITGLLPPTSGRIVKDGEPLPPQTRDRSRALLQQIQMIYQSPDTALNPRQRVRDIIGRPLQFYLNLSGAARRRRTEELLERIELPPDKFMERLPGELSGGQKQRVCIARALAAEPQAVICDEITSALDQIVAEGILRLLQKLQEDLGLAYFFITHDISLVRAVADEVALMRHGRLEALDGREEFFAPPHGDYASLLLSSVPEMRPDWLTDILSSRPPSSAQSALPR